MLLESSIKPLKEVPIDQFGISSSNLDHIQPDAATRTAAQPSQLEPPEPPEFPQELPNILRIIVSQQKTLKVLVIPIMQFVNFNFFKIKALQLLAMARQTKQIDADSTTRPPVRPRWLSLPQMRYQNAYVWILFFSSLDVMLTFLILRRNDGSTQEVNPIANAVIDGWGGVEGFGMAGASVLKFTLVALAIVICEVVGRTNDNKGKYLAWVLAGIAAVPVVWSLALLFSHQEILISFN